MTNATGPDADLSDVSHRLDLLEVYVQSVGPLEVRQPEGSCRGSVTTLDVPGVQPPTAIDRKSQLVERYVAVLETRRARAALVERGEDPGPLLRLVDTDATEPGTGSPVTEPKTEYERVLQAVFGEVSEAWFQ